MSSASAPVTLGSRDDAHGLAATRAFMHHYALVLSAIALAPIAAFLVEPTILGDDWRHYNDESAWQYRWGVRNGRPLFSVGVWLLGDARLAHPWSLLVLAAALVLFACVVAVRLSGNNAIRLAAVALMTTSPLLVENYQFSVNHGGVALGFVLVAFATSATPRTTLSPQRMVVVGLFAGLAALTRQDFLLVATAVVLTVVCIEWATSTTRPALRPLVIGFFTYLATAIGSYVVLAALARRAFGLTAPTSGQYTSELALAPGQLVDHTTRMVDYLVVYLFQAQAHIPMIMKLLVLWLLAAGVYAVATSATGKVRSVIAVVVPALLILPFVLGLIREPNSYRYAGMGGLHVFLPLTFLLISSVATSATARRFVLALGVVVALLGAQELNIAGSAAARAAEQDLSLITQIASDAELLEHPERTVVLHGRCATPNVADQGFGWNTIIDTPENWTSTIIEGGRLQCQRFRANSAYHLSTAWSGAERPGPDSGPFVDFSSLSGTERAQIKERYAAMGDRPVLFALTENLWVYLFPNAHS